MTVASQVRQALASLKGAQADLESFAMQSHDPHARDLYAQAAEQLQPVIDHMERRIQQLERQEPQYRGL